jgi:hypothetical protein
MKVYSNKSNCARGARTALKNPRAESGKDFTVVAVTGGFTFELPASKPKAEKVRRPRGGPKPSILGQPQAMRAIELCRRDGGCTVADGAKILDVEPHTFRGLISRCNAAGAGITKGRAFRVVTYIAPPAADAAPPANDDNPATAAIADHSNHAAA